MTTSQDNSPEERRILCVVRWPVGGIRTYIQYFYPTLAEAGYRFTFIGPDDETFRKFREELETWQDTEFVAAPLKGEYCQLRRAVRRCLESRRYSLIHSQGVKAAVQVVLANVGRKRIPHVMTSHDVFRPIHRQGMVGWMRLRFLAEFLRRIDTIVTVGDDAHRNHLEYLPQLARGPCRVVAIRNGINTQRFADNRGISAAGLREQFGLGQDVKLIGFLGRFMEQKGFLVLVEALTHLQRMSVDVSFRVLAVASGEFEAQYRAEIRRRGLDHLIVFHPFVTDTRPILREIDLLVVPSLWEACPLLPMEAMVAGVPVLGSSCIGLREVLADTPSMQVPPGDASALALALKQVIETPWRQEALAFVPEACRRFDVRQSAMRLRNLFDSHSIIECSIQVCS